MIGFRLSDLFGIFRSLGEVESFTGACNKSKTITCYIKHINDVLGRYLAIPGTSLDDFPQKKPCGDM